MKLLFNFLKTPFSLGALYLLLIPIFAWIFYSLPKYSFHHTTVQFEESVQVAKQNAKKAVLAAIKTSFKKRHGSDPFLIDGFSSSGDNIDLTDFDCADDHCIFEVLISFKKFQNSIVGLSERVELFSPPIQPGDRFQTFSPGGSSLRGVKVSPWGNISELASAGIGPHTDLHFLLDEHIEGSLGEVIDLDPNIEFSIREYKYAKLGFPSEIPNNFLRMFYFSATTLTTLGLGDILPISDLARALVSLESILGIIVIGLFLNSLSQRPKEAGK